MAFFTAGLTGVFFALSFLWLGYPPRFSVILGVVGGIAGGLIAFWWQVDTVPEPTDEIHSSTSTPIKDNPKKHLLEIPTSFPRFLPKNPPSSQAKSSQSHQMNHRQLSRHQGSTLLDWLLMRNKRTPKSRR